jgi:hypothetical protein
MKSYFIHEINSSVPSSERTVFHPASASDSEFLSFTIISNGWADIVKAGRGSVVGFGSPGTVETSKVFIIVVKDMKSEA